MDNTIPCSKCVFYDVILGPREKVTKRGWCVKRSLYPHKEEDGQSFPPGAQRVTAGERAKPYIVRGSVVKKDCDLVREKWSR